MLVSGALLALLLLAQQQDPVSEGMKALDANQPAAAETFFRQAVATAPDDVGAHFDLSLALSIEGKDSDAISELRRTLEIKPGLFEADLNLGILLLRDKEPADALVALR